MMSWRVKRSANSTITFITEKLSAWVYGWHAHTALNMFWKRSYINIHLEVYCPKNACKCNCNFTNTSSTETVSGHSWPGKIKQSFKFCWINCTHNFNWQVCYAQTQEHIWWEPLWVQTPEMNALAIKVWNFRKIWPDSKPNPQNIFLDMSLVMPCHNR